MFEQPRAANVRLVDVAMVIVVLEDGDHLWEGSAGYEHHSDPVVNQAAGNANRSAIRFRVELFNVNLPLLKFRVLFSPENLGEAIDC